MSPKSTLQIKFTKILLSKFCVVFRKVEAWGAWDRGIGRLLTDRILFAIWKPRALQVGLPWAGLSRGSLHQKRKETAERPVNPSLRRSSYWCGRRDYQSIPAVQLMLRKRQHALYGCSWAIQRNVPQEYRQGKNGWLHSLEKFSLLSRLF